MPLPTSRRFQRDGILGEGVPSDDVDRVPSDDGAEDVHEDDEAEDDDDDDDDDKHDPKVSECESECGAAQCKSTDKRVFSTPPYPYSLQISLSAWPEVVSHARGTAKV